MWSFLLSSVHRGCSAPVRNLLEVNTGQVEQPCPGVNSSLLARLCAVDARCPLSFLAGVGAESRQGMEKELVFSFLVAARDWSPQCDQLFSSVGSQANSVLSRAGTPELHVESPGTPKQGKEGPAEGDRVANKMDHRFVCKHAASLGRIRRHFEDHPALPRPSASPCGGSARSITAASQGLPVPGHKWCG